MLSKNFKLIVIVIPIMLSYMAKHHKGRLRKNPLTLEELQEKIAEVKLDLGFVKKGVIGGRSNQVIKGLIKEGGIVRYGIKQGNGRIIQTYVIDSKRLQEIWKSDPLGQLLEKMNDARGLINLP